MAQPPRVLVTDAGRGSAIAFIRSLGRRGWHVIAADSTGRSPGFRSRYAAGRLHYPDPTVDPDGAAAAILAAARAERIDLVVPVTDEILAPLAARRGELPASCRLAAPSDELLELTMDKAATLELARRLGIATPETRLVQTVDEAMAAREDLGWPVVVKPRRSRGRRPGGGTARYEVAYADDEGDLRRIVAALEGRVDLLLQRYIPGLGVGVELLLVDGRPLAAFAHRRIHEVPITGGASSLRESIPLTPQLLDPAARLLGAMGWTGLAMVESRIGPDGPVLMEINGRIWGSLPLAIAAGMDFPGRLADLLLPTSATVGPENGLLFTDYRAGVRSRNLQLEVAWIGSVLRGRRRSHRLPIPPRRAALAAAVRLLDPRQRDDILWLHDPGPGAAEILRIVGKVATKATHHG